MLINQSVKLGVDHSLTVVATGTMAAPQILLIDDAPPTFDETTTLSEIRLVHAATAAPGSVDFHVTTDNVPTGAPSATLSAHSASGLISVEAATNLRLRVQDAGGSNLLWDSGTFPVAAASRPLFVLIDYFGPGPGAVRTIAVSELSSTTFPDEQLTAAVSLANMIADRGPVDIYLDDVLAGADLLFGDVENYVVTPPGEYTLKVTTGNDVNDVIIELPGIINNGEFHTVIAAGQADAYTIINTRDDLRRVATRSALTLSNVAPSLGTVDVYVLDPGQSVNDFRATIVQLGFPGSQNVGLFAGTYDLILTDFNTKTVVLGPELINLDASGLYRVYVTDSVGGGLPAQAVLGFDFDPGFNP